MKIGALAEVYPGENRVAMTPDSAAALIKLGHVCVVQAGAGVKAGFADAMYSKAGVEVLPDAAAVMAAADVLVKVRGPEMAEAQALRDG
ncbi:MAG: NAD(P)(+) transhydrogenase (Re/Si-specific) subunit alpha, partial [Pseudorhodobacter sp.]|nr:NAD(P)(+) transhydrogenase (Re/Si-specific) subunit alpha [Pseudorhodobacter sp.]